MKTDWPIFARFLDKNAFPTNKSPLRPGTELNAQQVAQAGAAVLVSRLRDVLPWAGARGMYIKGERDANRGPEAEAAALNERIQRWDGRGGRQNRWGLIYMIWWACYLLFSFYFLKKLKLVIYCIIVAIEILVYLKNVGYKWASFFQLSY